MKNILRHAPTVGRVVLGLVFFVFGLDGFFHFIPKPSTMPDAAMAFAGALMKTGYMLPEIKSVEVIAGVLLLANRFVPLALTVLAPIVVNIVLFHAFLDRSGIAVALVVLAIEVGLAWSYRGAFRSMLAARTTT
jgi:hypothetical protein